MAIVLVGVALAAAAPAQAAPRPWPDPVTLSDPGVRWPKVAVDARGDVLAVWDELHGFSWLQRYRWYEPGSGWGPARVLARGSEPFADIALTPRGEGTVTWTEHDAQDRWSTWSASAQAGDTFAPPRELSQGFSPAPLEVDDEGGAVLVQSQIDRSDGGGLFVTTREPGGDFGAPQRIGGAPGSAQAAISPPGAAAAVGATEDNTTLLSYPPAGGGIPPPPPPPRAPPPPPPPPPHPPLQREHGDLRRDRGLPVRRRRGRAPAVGLGRRAWEITA